MPPQLEAAFAHLSQSIQAVEGKPVDLVKASWGDLEKSIIKVLKGAFNLGNQEHQIVALGLSVVLAARLSADHQAFWFPYRETPEGASLGFPQALIMLSPFGAVLEALKAAKLDKLADVEKDIRTALAQVKFSAGASAPMNLGPEDYMRLFDPAFVQLVSIDAEKAKQTWSLSPERVSIDLRDAISRAARLPPEVKKQMEQQFVTALSRLESGKPLIQQVLRGPRVIETMGLLFASPGSTGAAAEEFWSDVVMPLLLVGAPATFPPVGDDELAAAKQGVDPLFLFLDSVPYQFKSPDEEGLLGVFAGASLALPAPEFQGITQLRLIKVDVTPLKDALAAFDPVKTREAIKRFGELVKAKVGATSAAPQGADEAKMMLDAAMTLLGDLKNLASNGKDLYVRRLTEAEASSEPAFTLVRQALSAPRIILATS